MKNKKIIILTVFIISATVFGVLGMSNIFENIWQASGEKESSYTVNQENLQGEATVFNYPYFDVKEHNRITDNFVRERYASDIDLYELTLAQDSSNRIILANVDKSPVDDMVSYQYVANLCGEAVKYLYGITEHQNFPSVITYFYNISGKGEEHVYSHRIRTNDDYIEMLVDSYTGEIYSVSTSGGLVIELSENLEEDRKTDFLTDTVKAALIAQTNENLDILGNSKKIERYEFLDMHRMLGCNKFIVKVFHTDGTESSMSFDTVDFDYYELTHYGTTH